MSKKHFTFDKKLRLKSIMEKANSKQMTIFVSLITYIVFTIKNNIAPKIGEFYPCDVSYRPSVGGAFILIAMRRVIIKGTTCPYCGGNNITSKGRWNRNAYLKGLPQGEDRRYLCRSCGRFFCSVDRSKERWNNPDRLECRHCGSLNIRKRNYKRNYQYYFCGDCGRHSSFSEFILRREASSKIKDGKKLCNICGEIKPLSEFYKCKNTKCGYRGGCKKCLRKRNNDEFRYLLQYGLSKDDLEMLLKIQNNKCLICNNPITVKNGKKRACIDHDHSNGVIRGVLCHNCNRLLGASCENTTIFKRAILYLEKEINKLTYGND